MVGLLHTKSVPGVRYLYNYSKLTSWISLSALGMNSSSNTLCDRHVIDKDVRHNGIFFATDVLDGTSRFIVFSEVLEVSLTQV